jgi:hypothetical protein
VDRVVRPHEYSGGILNLPDPTGEQAVRNILSGADWSEHADWQLLGPWRGNGQPITVLLDSRLALAIIELLGREAELKLTRRGQNVRARPKKKAPAAPTAEAKSNQ